MTNRDVLNETIDRRGFFKHLALSGLSILYGCSKDTLSPDSNSKQNEPEPEPQPSSTTKVALYKTQTEAKVYKKSWRCWILPSLHMSELHSSSQINSMIAEINLAYKPKLIIMDGVKTFISGGPSHGTVRDGNIIVAGTNRIAIDAVGTAILKDLGSTRVSGKIFELEQIKRAVELNLGIKTPDQIEFITIDDTSHEYANKLTEILMQG